MSDFALPKSGCVVVFLVLTLLISGIASAQSFPDEADVLRRLDSIESRLSILEAAVRPVRSTAVSPSSFQLAPGERLVAVEGVPVGFPTLAVPVRSAAPTIQRTLVTPRVYRQTIYSSPPVCFGPDCR